MLEESSFKNKALKKAEDYFKDVHMTQDQHRIFLDFVDIFLNNIPMSETAAKGIGWGAVSEWQLRHKRDLLGLESEPPEERIKSIGQIMDIVKDKLMEILKDQANEPQVEETMKKIMNFYKEKHANR